MKKPNENRLMIQGITGLTDQEYCNHVYQLAEQYLEISFKFTSSQRKKLLECQMFWMWWIRQWNLREEAMIGRYMLAQAMGEAWNLEREWRKCHSMVHIMMLQPNKWALTSILSVIETHGKIVGTQTTA